MFSLDESDIFDYLQGDPRRLAIGAQSDHTSDLMADADLSVNRLCSQTLGTSSHSTA